MKIYKFIQDGDWAVLIRAKNAAKAKYALWKLSLSFGCVWSFMECLSDFYYAGTISKEEAQKLIEAEDCNADFEVHQIEGAEKMSEKLVNIITCDNMKADVVLLADGKITVMEFSQMHKKIEKLEASNAEMLEENAALKKRITELGRQLQEYKEENVKLLQQCLSLYRAVKKANAELDKIEESCDNNVWFSQLKERTY